MRREVVILGLEFLVEEINGGRGHFFFVDFGKLVVVLAFDDSPDRVRRVVARHLRVLPVQHRVPLLHVAAVLHWGYHVVVNQALAQRHDLHVLELLVRYKAVAVPLLGLVLVFRSIVLHG